MVIFIRDLNFLTNFFDHIDFDIEIVIDNIQEENYDSHFYFAFNFDFYCLVSILVEILKNYWADILEVFLVFYFQFIILVGILDDY